MLACPKSAIRDILRDGKWRAFRSPAGDAGDLIVQMSLHYPHPGAAVLSSFAIIRYPGVHRSWIIDRDRIAEAILALLFLGRHDGIRAWKSFDWAAMEPLHTKGLISDPIGKAKSIVFIDEGLRQSEALFRKLFAVGRQD